MTQQSGPHPCRVERHAASSWTALTNQLGALRSGCSAAPQPRNTLFCRLRPCSSALQQLFSRLLKSRVSRCRNRSYLPRLPSAATQTCLRLWPLPWRPFLFVLSARLRVAIRAVGLRQNDLAMHPPSQTAETHSSTRPCTACTCLQRTNA
eukprot:3615281-Rhodomonas_salina.1